MKEDPASSIDASPGKNRDGAAIPRAGIKIEVRVEDAAWLRLDFDPQELADPLVVESLAVATSGTGLPDFPVEVEVGILFTGDRQMKRLNATHRGVDRPTNVLAFPIAASRQDLAAELERTPTGGAVVLGDVVLALGTILEECERGGKLLTDHLSHLIVHGVLHLLCFDHIDDDEAAAMEVLEIRILEGMGISNPYNIGLDSAGLLARKATRNGG